MEGLASRKRRAKRAERSFLGGRALRVVSQVMWARKAEGRVRERKSRAVSWVLRRVRWVAIRKLARMRSWSVTMALRCLEVDLRLARSVRGRCLRVSRRISLGMLPRVGLVVAILGCVAEVVFRDLVFVYLCLKNV